MPIRQAMIEDVITVGPDVTVGEALGKFLNSSIRTLPVVDADGKYLGVFNFRQLIGKMLPTSATMEGGLERIDFLHDSMDEVGEKLKEYKTHKVNELMRDDIPTLSPEVSFGEALLMLYQQNMPLPVVEEESGHLVGLFTKQSAITSLMNGNMAG